LEALASAYFSLPPCSTRNSPLKDRLNYLMGKIESTGAKGVIFSLIKFCDPEYFNLPVIMQELKLKDIPFLSIETEVNQTIDSQTLTRIQAFSEMIDKI
jgi:benzoyl-CoA reductase/2-hydroxyglutaryl-CoA dehydratase subunit BcrC/BadD/HgdB